MKSEYYPTDKYGRIFAAMQWENALALRVGLETGARIGDILRLREGDLRGCRIYYEAEKTGKCMVGELTPQTAHDLKENLQNGMYFPGRWGDKPRTRQAVWKDLKRAVAVTRTKTHVTPHSTRKAFAVDMLAAAGLDATQKALGHTQKAVTELYAYSDRQTWSALQVDELATAIVKKLEHMFGLDKRP